MSAAKRYEIHVLVGPCFDHETEDLAEEILGLVEGRLGAAISISAFDEDAASSVAGSSADQGEK